MRVIWVVALFVGLSTSVSGEQQTGSSAQSSPTDAQSAKVKVYAAGSDVTAPELLPANLPPIPDEKCKKRQETDGTVMLSVIVDAAGHPRNLMFFHPVGTDLDKLALQIAAADRFKPGTSNGAPVAIAQLLYVIMQACVEQKKDDTGNKTYSLRLMSEPKQKLEVLPEPPKEAVLTSGDPVWNELSRNIPRIYRVGGSVSAPVLLNQVEAEFSNAARKAKYQGVCIVSLVIDVHGMPQNVQVVRPLDYGLNEKAIEAVNRYRFKPAMKNGVPVPVMMSVEIYFHLY
jgi:TonB family protein